MKKIKLLEPLNLVIEEGSIVDISDTQFFSLPKTVYEEIIDEDIQTPSEEIIDVKTTKQKNGKNKKDKEDI